MSGAGEFPQEIANEVFHLLHPECPAFPGIPNDCDTQVCDCFKCTDIPGQVRDLIADLARERARAERLRAALEHYGQHEYDCPSYLERDRNCSCGYSAALAEEAS